MLYSTADDIIWYLDRSRTRKGRRSDDCRDLDWLFSVIDEGKVPMD